MTTGGVTSTGMAEMRAAIQKLPAAVTAACRRVSRDTSHRIADNARRRIRVRTGATKLTIAVHEHPEQREYRVSVGADTGPPIAVFLEYGTEHMPAKPFFRAALEQEVHAHQRDLEVATETAARQTVR